jgi:5-methylcytosine-specific restriction endonuclease McrA
VNRAKMRAKLAKRQGGWTCHWCRGPAIEDAAGGQRATVDHLIPVSRGGADDMLNTVLSCQACNGERGAPEVTREQAAGEWARSHATKPWTQLNRPRLPATLAAWRAEARKPATHRMALELGWPK